MGTDKRSDSDMILYSEYLRSGNVRRELVRSCEASCYTEMQGTDIGFEF